MKIRFFSVLFLSCISIFHLYAQEDDYRWWNNIHNWDGVTSWSDYIPLVPGKMGPNALPVPDNQNGRLDTNLTLIVAPEVHLAPNDFTTNLFTRINVPIKKAIALQIWWVPVEYFKTDTVVRDMRAARTRSAEGFALGDVYIGTLIPLVTDKQGWPDLLLGINLKTASGTRLHDARFTDSPGYFFELSAGKDFTWPALLPKTTFRWYASSGFYVYQTNRDDYFQNDALMLGGGIDANTQKYTLRFQLNSYTGYFKELDTPLVSRLEFQYKMKSSKVFIRLQAGNESYAFTSIRGGMEFTIR